MIRSVAIPLEGLGFRRRIGQASTITYVGSNCTATDPRSGLCIPNVFLGDPSNIDPSGGGGAGDPAEAQAVADWVASQSGIQNSDILNAQQQPPAFVLAQSLFDGTIPSPLPGLGLATPKIPALQCFADAKVNGTSYLKCIPAWAWVVAAVAGIAIVRPGGRR